MWGVTAFVSKDDPGHEIFGAQMFYQVVDRLYSKPPQVYTWVIILDDFQ